MKESTVKDAFLCHKYEISTDKNLHNSSRFQFPTMVHTLRSENEE